MPDYLRLKAKISPDGEFLLDANSLKKYYNKLAKAGFLNNGLAEVNLAVYPERTAGQTFLPQSSSKEAGAGAASGTVQHLALKHKLETGTVKKLLASRNSIKSGAFIKNISGT